MLTLLLYAIIVTQMISHSDFYINNRFPGAHHYRSRRSLVLNRLTTDLYFLVEHTGTKGCKNNSSFIVRSFVVKKIAVKITRSLFIQSLNP